MVKILTSLGLMSGTSGDGVDASIIKSNGEIESNDKNVVELIKDKFFEYDKKTISKIHSLRDKINFSKDLEIHIKEIREIEREITLFHAKAAKEMIKGIDIDLIGFHGHTIFHNPKEKISKQIGDAELLFQLTNKTIVFNFREKDIKNGGEGAPLAPIYHCAIGINKEIELPYSFLNIGGISNITTFSHLPSGTFHARDIGPGNCLIDKWIRENSNFNYDKDGDIARSGIVNKLILEQVYNHRSQYFEGKSILDKQRSLDIKNYDLGFVRGLNLEDGAATLTEYTADLLCDFLTDNYFQVDLPSQLFNKIILMGGGRKNKFLVHKIKEKLGNTSQVFMIDDYGVNGDFVESQAFAFLAIRSFNNLPTSFPWTTGCEKENIGGEIIKN